MSDDQTMLVDTVRQLATDLKPGEGESETFDRALWSRFEDLGLTLISIPEDKGGTGGTIHHALAVVRTLAETTVRLPVPETSLLGGWLLSAADLPVPSGPISAGVLRDVGASRKNSDGGVTVTGVATSVPWGGACDHVALVGKATGEHFVASVDTADCTIHRKRNMANEPRDDLLLKELVIDPDQVSWSREGSDIMARGALIRSVQLVGAMRTALMQCAEYSVERKQFGHPISAFQAVRHMIAIAAEEYASAEAAVSIAVQGLGTSSEAVRIAIGKTRAGGAAAKVADISHQVLGAIGFTDEHELHFFTRALWAWRDEFGNEAYWADVLSRTLLEKEGPIWQQLIEILDERPAVGGSD